MIPEGRPFTFGVSGNCSEFDSSLDMSIGDSNRAGAFLFSCWEAGPSSTSETSSYFTAGTASGFLVGRLQKQTVKATEAQQLNNLRNWPLLLRSRPNFYVGNFFMLYSRNCFRLLSRSSAKTNSESYRGRTTEQLTEQASFLETKGQRRFPYRYPPLVWQPPQSWWHGSWQRYTMQQWGMQGWFKKG